VLVAGRGAPEPPSHLDAEERALFLEMVEAAGPILDLADGLLVESAVAMLETARAARRVIATQGLLVTNRHGATVPNPAVRVERDALAELRLVLSSLGMSPAARARLGSVAPSIDPPDVFDELSDAAEVRQLHPTRGA
jgi:P27 family predicted phage terminase small subunit